MSTQRTDEQYKCQSYYDEKNVLQDCTCGRCGDESVVEWKDGMIVEFMAYDMHLNEGGSEVWSTELSVFQRGIVLGDRTVGCDYELSKEDFVDGVYEDGVDPARGYNIDDYVKAVLVEPEWLTTALTETDQQARESIGERVTRAVIEASIIDEEEVTEEEFEGVSKVDAFMAGVAHMKKAVLIALSNPPSQV